MTELIKNEKIQKKVKKVLNWTFGIIGSLFLLIIILAICIPSDNSTTNNKQEFVGVGDEGKLYLEGETMVPVCVTKEYLKQLTDASVAKDIIGYRNLIMSYGTKCYITSTIEPYGEVLVLGYDGIGVRKFRFTNPDAIHYGEVGYTYMEYIISK